MPRRPLGRCTWPGCPERANGRCATHRREAERRRGSSSKRGYDRDHTERFRAGVLARDRICRRCREQPATVADHHPRSRRVLEQLGLDPNDPRYGRGLCERCHSIETARHQPGGWHAQ